MPHGLPDWGHVGPKTTTYGLDDLGEAVVRLGSPHLWDRRGDVLWMTEFTHGMGDVRQELSGLNAAIQLWTGEARQGAFCVRLTGGSNDERYAQLNKIVPYPWLSYFGVEFSFSYDNDVAYMVWKLEVYEPGRLQEASVRYDPVGRTLDYLTTAGVWTPFAAGVRTSRYPEASSTGKMVIDGTLGEYRYFLLNQVTYSMLGFVSSITVGPYDPLLAIWARVESLAATNATVCVDNMIVTHNEP